MHFSPSFLLYVITLRQKQHAIQFSRRGGNERYVANVCLLKSELLIHVQASIYRLQRKSHTRPPSNWRKIRSWRLTAPVKLGEYYTMPGNIELAFLSCVSTIIDTLSTTDQSFLSSTSTRALEYIQSTIHPLTEVSRKYR